MVLFWRNGANEEEVEGGGRKNKTVNFLLAGGGGGGGGGGRLATVAKLGKFLHRGPPPISSLLVVR